jgi:hypothetical protein
MSGSIFLWILTCLYLPERSEERWVILIFRRYLIFMSFYIYHFFGIPEYLTLKYLLCIDVGPVHPIDFSRTRRHH